MSLAVQKIDSMGWRIGARCGPWPASSFRRGRVILVLERCEIGFELAAAEVLVADRDRHLAGLALAARDQLQADLALVDLR